MICGVFVVSQVYLLIPLISTLKNHYTISTGSAEWVISAFGFAYATGFLTLGPLSDCYSRKKFIAIGLIALSIVTFMIGFVLMW